MTDEAFAQAARTYGDTVYRVAYHALSNPQDAEDVMQTVLLRLYEHKKEFESEEHMKHWLLRVAVNESRKLLRSAWRRTSVSLEEWHDGAAPEDPAKAEVLEAVMALEPKYRVSVYLYYYEGLTVAEVAAAMKANPSTVQTWLLRARARLRKALSEEGRNLSMFDPKLYREACREITAPEDKIEEIIAMTENTNKKPARRPLRTAMIAAAAIAMMVVSVAAANPEGVEELFFNLGNVVRIDRYRSDVTTEEGNTFSLVSCPESRVVNRDGRAVLTLNGEDVKDITDALAQDQHYVFEDFSEDSRITVTVDGTIDQWTIETEVGVVEEDGAYTRLGSTTVTSEEADNALDGGMFVSGNPFENRDVNVADVEITTGMYVTVDKDCENK